MTPNFKVFLSLLAACVLMVFLSSCTFAKIETAAGTQGTYVDFHPTGNAVSARGVLEGLGEFSVDRDTGDSGQVISDVVGAVVL